MMGLDAISSAIALALACELVDFHFPLNPLHSAVVFLLVVAVQLCCLFGLSFYQSSVRQAGIHSLWIIIRSATISTLLLIIVSRSISIYFPTGFLFVDWLLLVFLVGGSRFLVRLCFELKQNARRGKKVIIYGAGTMGSLAVRQLRLETEIACTPVAFLDDNPIKLKSVVQGIKVVGSIKDLEKTIDDFAAEEVVVAVANMPGDRLREIVQRCRRKNVVCRILPRFSQMLKMEPKMRNIELTDLMRRMPCNLDNVIIGKYLAEKTILITGAAGSIGSELVRQCLQYGARKVIAFDQSEFGLYTLREEIQENNAHYILGNACRRPSIEKVFRDEKPDIVFHAAAYKHVSMLELNPVEAVYNNIKSTKNLVELAHHYKTHGFVLISTDKAVKPSSVMGKTKRACELLVQNFDRFSSTAFVAVRFGNVLGSSGSVVPKFMEQIKRGGPVTVTHPEATRYFMLTGEAVQLILQAASSGKGGEIFILNMGKPVKILEMAEDLIYLMGYRPHQDVTIHFSGLSPGEKIFEELFHEEIEEKTDFEDIMIGRSVFFDWLYLEKKIEELLKFCEKGEESELFAMLNNLVINKNFSLPNAYQETIIYEAGNISS